MELEPILPDQVFSNLRNGVNYIVTGTGKMRVKNISRWVNSVTFHEPGESETQFTRDEDSFRKDFKRVQR